MTPGQRKRALWLGVAVVAGAGLLLMRTYLAAPVAEGASPAGAGPSRVPAAGVPLTSVEEVRVNRLAHAAPVLPEHTRDPFRYRQAPPPPPKAAPARARPMLGPPAPLPPPQAPPVPPPPPIPLKFVGVVVAAGATGAVAVLSDSRGGVFYGREGDIIDGRYRLVKVSADSAEVMYPDGRGRQVLRLSGQ